MSSRAGKCKATSFDRAPGAGAVYCIREEGHPVGAPGHTYCVEQEQHTDGCLSWCDVEVESKSDTLLHRLWTKAVGTANYDKSEWVQLQAQFERMAGKK
jgi:hypothetical protein